ncbi:hypothetical protein V5799_009189 [Amblyomma americanum]|uniref:Uncharacterized protein n=1 Tax=Amblyomma americanum TaxID=6943 RepID=A0AAQ4FBS8_AMBAM
MPCRTTSRASGCPAERSHNGLQQSSKCLRKRAQTAQSLLIPSKGVAGEGPQKRMMRARMSQKMLVKRHSAIPSQESEAAQSRAKRRQRRNSEGRDRSKSVPVSTPWGTVRLKCMKQLVNTANTAAPKENHARNST